MSSAASASFPAALPSPGRLITPGDPAPWVRQRTTATTDYVFHTVGGRHVLLCFYGTAGDEAGRAALDAMLAAEELFDDANLCLFGVSLDPADVAEERIAERVPGIRHFLDHDGKVSRAFGALPADAAATPAALQRAFLLLDPTLRVVETFGLDEHERLLSVLRALPSPDRFAGFEIAPPVLVLPNVFELGLCRHLIGLYDAHGGRETGTMREIDGRTVEVFDSRSKKRRDYTVEDPQLVRQLQARIMRRVVPEIEKVHFFKATRMERYIVSCYAAEDGGVFTAHRDNVTPGTAHRRFAVSINLNAEFEGGEVSFPEYSPRGYKVRPGAAVVFSCSLLHAVSTVTAGRRYAFLPFVYDEAAAKVREANAALIGASGSNYRANAD